MEYKLLDFQETLDKYVKGKIYFSPVINTLRDNYENLGKYIIDKIDISQDPGLKFFADKVSREKIRKIKDFIGFRDNTLAAIGLSFVPQCLTLKALTKMFGEPLLHSEYGEGFEEMDIEDYELDIREEITYASWFVNIQGIDFHIGLDHRGGNIETTGKDPRKVFECLKVIVDLYSEKVH